LCSFDNWAELLASTLSAISAFCERAVWNGPKRKTIPIVASNIDEREKIETRNKVPHGDRERSLVSNADWAEQI